MANDIDFEEIKKEYVSGSGSLRELAEKFGITYSSIANRSKKDGWVKLRNRVRSKRDAKTVDRISSEQAKTRLKIYRAADRALDRVTEVIEDRDTPLNAKELRSLAGALKDLKEVQDVKSVKDLEEQTARIKKLQKEAREETNEDRTVTVRFADAESGEYGE